MAVTGKVKRKLLLTYIDVDQNDSTPDYELLGDGVTDMSITYNAVTEEETYIHQDTGNTTVTGYQPTISATAQMFGGNPALEFLDNLRMRRAVLAEAETTIVNVYEYASSTGSTYVAEKQRVSAQFDDFGGAGGESLSFGFTLNYVGDHALGTWDPTDRKFTATTVFSGTTGGVGIVPTSTPANEVSADKKSTRS